MFIYHEMAILEFVFKLYINNIYIDMFILN